MLLNDDNFKMQGGVRNYLGKTKEVQAPKYWKSSPDSPSTELAYITEAEKGLLLDANLHGSLQNGKPNIGASGLLSYDGWGDVSSGGVSDTSGGNAGAEGGQGDGSGGYNSGNNNQSSDSGHSRFDVGSGYYGEPTTSTPSSNDNDNNYKVPDPVLPPGVVSKNFDYETEAYSTGPNDIDQGYGLGEITNATYNAKTGLVDIEQTPGIINTEQYQTANLGAYLDSPDVSDKAKAKTLNQLQALSNSNLKGSKLSNIETDFVLNNLDLAFNNVKDQTKYSKYTSLIDETNTTFADDFSKNPVGTVVKSGGIIGSMFRGITDTYKNNKALGVLGYTGKTIKYNPDGSGDFKYDGNYLTGNSGEGERDAVNQLTPLAANVIGGTQQQASQAAQWYNSIGSNTQQFNFATAYANAKTKVSQTLNNKGAIGMLAVNDSPYYDWLKTKNLDRGIL